MAAAGTFAGSVCLIKNRDRNYVPRIKVVHELRNGIEVAYLYDITTDWSEGLNEHGIGITNSALMVKADEKEKKFDDVEDTKAKKIKRSQDGKRIRAALGKKTLKEALETLKTYQGGIKGHTIISDGKKVQTIEVTSGRETIVKLVKDGDLVVRTNHGFDHEDAGYTEGDSRESSLLRLDLAIKALNEVDDPEDLAPALVRVSKKGPSNFNPVRSTHNMSTTNQVVLDLKALRMMVYNIPGKVKWEGVENKLPEGHKPKIKIDVFEYVDLKKADPSYERVKT